LLPKIRAENSEVACSDVYGRRPKRVRSLADRRERQSDPHPTPPPRSHSTPLHSTPLSCRRQTFPSSSDLPSIYDRFVTGLTQWRDPQKSTRTHAIREGLHWDFDAETFQSSLPRFWHLLKTPLFGSFAPFATTNVTGLDFASIDIKLRLPRHSTFRRQFAGFALPRSFLAYLHVIPDRDNIVNQSKIYDDIRQ
jgi:hypothetical protein